MYYVLCVPCQMSHVTCHVPRVICHLSHVKIYIYIFFTLKNGQRGGTGRPTPSSKTTVGMT